jgi:hypothetical protein
MSRLKSYSTLILLSVIVIAVLVGVGGDGNRVSAQATGRRQLIIPASHFYPTANTHLYTNHGNFLVSNDGATIQFLAPVQLVVPYYGTVEKVELIAYDNTNLGRIRLWLYKTKPAIGNKATMAAIDTGVVFQDTTDPRIWTDSTITSPTIRPAEEAFLELEIDPAASLWVYGVRVWYHPGW